MHEFLLNLKRWQMSSAVQEPIKAITSKEAQCLQQCSQNSADEAALSTCQATCQKPRSDVQRYLYKKESQFLQQLYKDCYQSKESKETPEQCHQKYNENLQLIKEDLTQYLQEKASEL